MGLPFKLRWLDLWVSGGEAPQTQGAEEQRVHKQQGGPVAGLGFSKRGSNETRPGGRCGVRAQASQHRLVLHSETERTWKLGSRRPSGLGFKRLFVVM